VYQIVSESAEVCRRYDRNIWAHLFLGQGEYVAGRNTKHKNRFDFFSAGRVLYADRVMIRSVEQCEM